MKATMLETPGEGGLRQLPDREAGERPPLAEARRAGEARGSLAARLVPGRTHACRCSSGDHHAK